MKKEDFKTVFSTKISEEMAKRNLSAEKLSKIINLSRQQVYNYTNGTSLPDVEKLLEIAELFDLEVLEFIVPNYNLQSQSKFYKNRTIIKIDDATASAGIPTTADTASQHQLKSEIIELTDGIYIEIKVSGNSMAPTFKDCQTVVAKFIDDTQNIKFGKPYIILTNTQEIYLKRIEQGPPNTHTIELHSDNPTYPTFTIQKSEVAKIFKIGYAIEEF